MAEAATAGERSDVADRAWWTELGAVVPRSVGFAWRATGRAEEALPRLAANPLTWATVAVDELAVATAYLLARRGAERVGEQAVADSVEAVERLTAAGAVADPRLAHPAPGLPERVRLTHRSRAGVRFEHLSFASTYAAPVDLPGADRWTAEEGNGTAHGYLLRADRRPRPWVLVLHGHRMGEPRDLRLLGSLRLQRDLDVNVAHLVLPMHGPRARGGPAPFPGVDPIRNFLGMAQATSDARALLRWLRAGGADPVGVFGISLGGHVAGLLAGLEPDLAAVVAGVPTSDVATMLADTMRSRWGEEAVAASHVLDPAPRELSRLVSPLTFAPAVDPGRLFVYAARGDRLVTPQQAVALWEHWARPPILWLQGGHIANNVAASRRFVADSLAACGVAGPERA